MIKAQRGLLERQSFENSCLGADGEETHPTSQAAPVLSLLSPFLDVVIVFRDHVAPERDACCCGSAVMTAFPKPFP